MLLNGLGKQILLADPLPPGDPAEALVQLAIDVYRDGSVRELLLNRHFRHTRMLPGNSARLLTSAC